MRYFFLVIYCFLLSNCYYSDGCIYSPQMVNCYIDKGKPYPPPAWYQKKDSIGHTNSKQRSKDLKSCGSDDTLMDFSSGYENFRKCMKSKGYIRFEPAECGYQKPQWSTGKCNL